jgi:uncharacterized membrane protein YkoI
MRSGFPLLCLVLTTTLALGPSHVRADWADEDRSHDRARRATERGEILPLTAIYERALASLPGRVLEAELEREHDRWVYELKILDADGRLFEVYLDAGTGAFLKQEGED